MRFPVGMPEYYYIWVFSVYVALHLVVKTTEQMFTTLSFIIPHFELYGLYFHGVIGLFGKILR